jgi:hypothetical protein
VEREKEGERVRLRRGYVSGGGGGGKRGGKGGTTTQLRRFCSYTFDHDDDDDDPDNERKRRTRNSLLNLLSLFSSSSSSSSSLRFFSSWERDFVGCFSGKDGDDGGLVQRRRADDVSVFGGGREAQFGAKDYRKITIVFGVSLREIRQRQQQ